MASRAHMEGPGIKVAAINEVPIDIYKKILGYGYKNMIVGKGCFQSLTLLLNCINFSYEKIDSSKYNRLS